MLWDKRKSNEARTIIHNADWLTLTGHQGAGRSSFTEKKLFDFAQQYIVLLRGVFAMPTASKLKQLNECLSAPQNLHSRLWPNMKLKLLETFRSYGVEYLALLETVARHSTNTIQLHAAYQLASIMNDTPAKMKRIRKEIEAPPSFMLTK